MTTRALVLSGGGPVGIAWEAGMVAGLAEAGADLRAERIVGTSAGSVVGAQLALGVAPARVAENQLAPPDGSAAAASSGGEAPRIPDELIAAFLGSDDDPQETRRTVGAFALQADTIAEDEFLATFGSRLGDADWPAGFVCTAVDTADGAFVAFDEHADVPLVRAVTASCAVPGIFPPITIGDRRYMDGGIRSLTNADLAVGCDEVVVISLVGGVDDGGASNPLAARVEAEIATLREHGATVRLFHPDAGARREMGPNLMDAGRRAQAAEAGLAQGRAEAAGLVG